MRTQIISVEHATASPLDELAIVLSIYEMDNYVSIQYLET